MKENDLIIDVSHVNVDYLTPQEVTYNFDRSAEIFIKIFKESYTAPDGNFFVEPACKALYNLSEALINNKDAVVLFDSKEGVYNVLSILNDYPTIITTFESEPLMVILGKYMSRSDISKPNGDFNPISIFNCAHDEFGIDLASAIPIPFASNSQKKAIISDFLNKM